MFVIFLVKCFFFFVCGIKVKIVFFNFRVEWFGVLVGNFKCGIFIKNGEWLLL